MLKLKLLTLLLLPVRRSPPGLACGDSRMARRAQRPQVLDATAATALVDSDDVICLPEGALADANPPAAATRTRLALERVLLWE